MTHPDLAYALGDAVRRDIAEGDEVFHRDVRVTLDNVENQLSYVRRVAQSRIDMARSELDQRRAGKARSDLADVIRRLPEVLSDETVPKGLPRFAPAEIDPDPAYSVELDDVVPPMRILEIGQLSRGELHEIIVRLESIEARTSVQRRLVHDVLDELNRAVLANYHPAS